MDYISLVAKYNKKNGKDTKITLIIKEAVRGSWRRYEMFFDSIN